MLPSGQHEVKIDDKDFVGYIDLIGDDHNLYDFKYSNSVERYMASPQLSLYKYFAEKNGLRVNKLFYVFIPKTLIRQKKTETLYEFRKRLIETLSGMEIQIREAQYNINSVIDYLLHVKQLLESTDYPCAESDKLCPWCEYFDYCKKGDISMLLPSVTRRVIGDHQRARVWIYGPAFSGKTTMLDDAPNPLNLNTDGNVNFVTMPVLPIRDQYEGRIKKTSWEVFKEAIEELEKKQNDFKTIIVDLLEDTREACRVYMYAKLGIQHESDASYGKGYDIVKTEYLSTMRRFFNLPYDNIIAVSHEDSKEVNKKNGSSTTTIKPNMPDAIANKIAGMVDIVARVVVDGDERTLQFKSDEYVFGGGRMTGITETVIPLKWSELMRVYQQCNENANKDAQQTEAVKAEPKTVEQPQEEPEPQTQEDQPRKRVRKVRNNE